MHRYVQTAHILHMDVSVTVCAPLRYVQPGLCLPVESATRRAVKLIDTRGTGNQVATVALYIDLRRL